MIPLIPNEPGDEKDRLTLLPRGSYSFVIPDGCIVEPLIDEGSIEDNLTKPVPLVPEKIPSARPSLERPSVDASALTGAIESVASAIKPNSPKEVNPPNDADMLEATTFTYTGSYEPLRLRVRDKN